MNKKKRWSEQELETLKNLVRNNTPNKEIASKLQRSESSIITTKHKYKIVSPFFIDSKWQPDDLIKLREYRRQGYSDSKLSKIFCRSISSVKIKLAELGIKSPLDKGHWSDDEIKTLKELVAKGTTKREISAILNRSLVSVRAKSMHLKLDSRPPRKWAQEEIELFENLLKNGLSIKEISIEMNRGEHGLVFLAKKFKWHKIYKQIRIHRNIVTKNENGDFVTAINRKLSSSERTATNKGLEYNLDLKFIKEMWDKQNGKCYYTGQKMNFLPNYYDSFSIDRMVSSGGYTKDNVCLCTAVINWMKSDMNDVEFIRTCKQIARRHK